MYMNIICPNNITKNEPLTAPNGQLLFRQLMDKDLVSPFETPHNAPLKLSSMTLNVFH